MKQAGKNSGLYAYLDSIKVLETGSAVDITLAKQKYKKMYKANWRRERRHAAKVFEIALMGDEITDVSKAAKVHKMSKTKFIKAACLAYIQKQFVVPDIHSVNVIRQLLAVNYTYLQTLFDENRIPFEIGKDLMLRMAELENGVLSTLVNPKPLEQFILEEVQRNASFKAWLIEFSKTADGDN